MLLLLQDPLRSLVQTSSRHSKVSVGDHDAPRLAHMAVGRGFARLSVASGPVGAGLIAGGPVADELGRMKCGGMIW